MTHPTSRLPSRRRRAAAIAGACALAAGVTGLASLGGDAGAAPSQSQNFFRTKLLEDPRTSKTIRDMIRNEGAFVDGSIAFRDLTGDKRTDAIVRVQSGTAAGAVAFYIFSTDGLDSEEGELRAIYRQQALTRAWTQVKDNVLTYRTAVYARGDETCCPSKQVQTRLRWSKSKRKFEVAERKDVAAVPTPTPGATVSPEASATATPTATP